MQLFEALSRVAWHYRGLVIDLERLFRIRLVVARHGEMDRSGWWNTRGMLGPYGAIALERGLPRTHLFAQARVVFAVATARCAEFFDPPDAVTLWKLPAELEDELDDHWHRWLAHPEQFAPLFEQLRSEAHGGLLDELVATDLVSPEGADAASALRRSAEGRAVQIPAGRLDDRLIALLGAGFSKGEQGSPSVPYATVVP